MLMHHICAVSLLFSMCFANCLPIGVTISFLHDIADITVSLAKFFGGTDYSNLAAGSMVTNMILWGYTRMIVLPYMIFNIFTFVQTTPSVSQQAFQSGFEMFIIISLISGIMLCAMCFLHFFWFSIFVKMIIVKIKTGKSEDIQNKVQDKSVKKTD
jgi:hypothetical protein